MVKISEKLKGIYDFKKKLYLFIINNNNLIGREIILEINFIIMKFFKT